MKILAVIPARAGSKGVPGKNIKPVGGKELIGWTILAAKNARSIDRIVVSTDGQDIAEVARKYGAEVPFMRPAELALDGTPGTPPLLHALDWLEQNQGYKPDYVMLLQPTSPLRTAEDIEGAIKIALEKKADAVVSVSPTARHPYWAKVIRSDGRLDHFLPGEGTKTRRQELPPVYDLNGAVYLIKPDVLRETGTWYPPNTFPYVMPLERSLDVDTPWDIRIADLVLKDRG